MTGGGGAPDAGPAVRRAVPVLLVEDSDTQALQIRRRLEREGFSVQRASSAEAALEALNGALPAIVVSDYHLPGMSGGELVRTLRLNVRTRAIPVLMLTEASEPGVEREGLESGADAYVPKSADMALIAMRMRALTRRFLFDAVDARGTPEGAEAGRFRPARIALLGGEGGPPATLEAALRRDGHEAWTAVGAAIREPGGGGAAVDPDCVVVDLRAGDALDLAQGLARCSALHAGRRSENGIGGSARLVVLCGERRSGAAAAAYEAGADDVVEGELADDGLVMRIRAVVRRKLAQDEAARIDAELREQRLDAERAREEAAANAHKAALAGALAQANEGLAEANERLRDTQGKLVQAAKMASLGELVAGIAHEINNPLAFILGHQNTVERLLDRAAGELEGTGTADRLRKARERVNGMGLGLRRIQDLVVSLRRFSRLDESEQQDVDIPEAIDTVLALLAHKIGSGTTVRRTLLAPPVLRCQPALLNQVVMNIVGNAADALNARPDADRPPEGNLISIDTGLEDGSYRIAVADNGPGIAEAVRERVFEPFFTTKPVGSGTGLGLSIAWNVVRAHRGTIEVDRSERGGARFTIRVPASVGKGPE